MKVTIGMLKGGASRTTTAVFLAIALNRLYGHRVLLVDADPQNGTAFEWSEDAKSASVWPDSVQCMYWPLANLTRRIETELSHGYDSVVIDTGNDPAAIKAGLGATDRLLVPLAPSGTEATRLRPTLEAAAEVARNKEIELSVLLTRVVRGTRSRIDARDALEEEGLHVLATEIPRLERFASAYGTVPADIEPYGVLATEMMKKGR